MVADTMNAGATAITRRATVTTLKCIEHGLKLQRQCCLRKKRGAREVVCVNGPVRDVDGGGGRRGRDKKSPVNLGVPYYVDLRKINQTLASNE
jgi:hypothetical protein